MMTAQLFRLHPPCPWSTCCWGGPAPSSTSCLPRRAPASRDSGSHPAVSLASCAIWAEVSRLPSLCETRVVWDQERQGSETADWDPRELWDLELVLPPSLLGISRSQTCGATCAMLWSLSEGPDGVLGILIKLFAVLSP